MSRHSFAHRWVPQLIAGVLVLSGGFLVSRLLEPAQDPRGDIIDPSSPVVEAPTEITSIISEVFVGSGCHKASAAEVALRSRLDASGQGAWNVVRRAGVEDGDCVGTLILAAEHTIRLDPALRPEVREALAQVREFLMTKCLNQHDATEYITAILVGLGESGFAIRLGGPIAAPPDRIGEAVNHVKQGCFLYSGPGWTENGQAVYFLAGL